jgi:hypothetical protein
MTPTEFVARLGDPAHLFADTLAFVDEHYHHQPTAFRNGEVANAADQNQGSCKVLAMALDLGLTDQQALHCFAEHYQSVLADPAGIAHANIRALMHHGLAGVRFENPPLSRR